VLRIRTRACRRVWVRCDDGVAVGSLDTIARKLVDPFTYERTVKKAGNVVRAE